jgi:cell wall-associated NlpC family hydrolase
MAAYRNLIQITVVAMVLSACAASNAPYLAVDEAPPPQTLNYEGLLAAPVKPVTGARKRIVETAQSYLGAPAKRGGNTPQGFDCTGFVYYVYRQAAGITLPRKSHDQVQIGKAISPSSLQPGDLIYFTVPESRSFHVSLYLGEGRFIHAPSATDAVKTDSLGDAQWRSRFLGARQILPG